MEPDETLAWLVVWRTDRTEFRIIREDHLETYTQEFAHSGAPFDGPDRSGAFWEYYGCEAFGDPVTAAIAAAHIAAGSVARPGAVDWQIHPEQIVDWQIHPEQIVVPSPMTEAERRLGTRLRQPLMPPIDLAPRAGGTFAVLSGNARMAAARDLGIARLKGRVLHLAEIPEPVWMVLTSGGFTVEPRIDDEKA